MTKIDGLQVMVDVGSCSSRVILNADAESTGAEMELFVRPNESWDFGLSATYAKGEVTESFVNAVSGDPVGGIRDGNRLPTAPELQAVGTAAYNWAIGLGSKATCASRGNTSARRSRSSTTRNRDFGIIREWPVPGESRRWLGGLIDLGNVNVDTINFDPELPAYDIAQPALGHQRRTLGRRAVREQRVRRACVPVSGSRAWSPRARGLPHQSAAYLWREFPHQLLTRGTEMGTFPISWDKGVRDREGP